MDDWSCLTLVGLYFDCKNKGSVLQRGVKTWCGLLTSNLARETKENQWHFWFLLDGLMSRCPRARPVSGFIRAKNLQLLGRVTDMERLRAYSNVNPFEVADLLVGSALFVEPIMQNVAIKWILAITPSINKFLECPVPVEYSIALYKVMHQAAAREFFHNLKIYHEMNHTALDLVNRMDGFGIGSNHLIVPCTWQNSQDVQLSVDPEMSDHETMIDEEDFEHHVQEMRDEVEVGTPLAIDQRAEEIRVENPIMTG